MLIWMNNIEVGQPSQVLCRVPEHVRQCGVHLPPLPYRSMWGGARSSLQTSIYRADGKLAAMMIQTQMVLSEREWWQPASAAVTLKVDRRCIGAES